MTEDYPVGDGKADCKECHGRGVVPLPPMPNLVGDRTQVCVCVLARDVEWNVNRGLPGLMKSQAKPSNLKKYINRNLWITAVSLSYFKSELKYVAVREGPNWGFLMRTDRDLVSAWLSSKKKEEVRDSDVSIDLASMPDANVDLERMVIPPTLLIIAIGQKLARNSATPEVLLEALQLRSYIGKPTWLVDSDARRFEESNLPGESWSMASAELISDWKHLRITDEVTTSQIPTRTIKPQPLYVSQPEEREPEPELETPISRPSSGQEGTRGILTDKATEPKKQKWGRK